MTATPDDARAREIVDALLCGDCDELVQEIARALTEARDQGSRDGMPYPALGCMVSVNERSKYFADHRGIELKVVGVKLSPQGDVTVETAESPSATNYGRWNDHTDGWSPEELTVIGASTPSPAIAPPSAADIAALQAEEFIRTVCRELSLPYDAKPFDAAKRIREVQRQIERAPAIAPLREAVVPMYLIRKGALFYRSDFSGYTAEVDAAGRYTKAEAEAEAAVEPWHMQAVPDPGPGLKARRDAVVTAAMTAWRTTDPGWLSDAFAPLADACAALSAAQGAAAEERTP